MIERNGHVVARSGKVEYGQGIRTGFARIVADELSVPLDKVDVVLGETDDVPWDMGTVGSMSTATDGRQLRAAAIQARTLLLDRASVRLGFPPSRLVLAEGRAIAPDGNTVLYEDLVRDEPLSGDIPETADATNIPIPEAADGPLRLEARAILTGKATYPADVRLAGMLHGHVLHPPRPGMELVSFNDVEARALAGVVAVVREGDFIGIVAERDEALVAAIHALKTEWGPSPSRRAETYDAAIRSDSGVEAAFSGAARHLKAAYHAPHIAHASILPRSAVADVRENGADLYVATQRPFGLRDEVAALLGFPPEGIHVHPQMMSGMYGRGNVEDAAIEAVRLSRAAGRPVLVQWNRGEEFRLGPHRPAFDAEMEAALDAEGAIIGWRCNVRTNSYIQGPRGLTPGAPEMTAGRNAVPPYRLGSQEIRLHVEAGEVPTISFRSLGAAPNVFAIESFIDELAHAANRDPIDFRLGLTEDLRLRRVLETVRRQSAWQTPRTEQHGLGVACAIYHGTYIAQVAEVSVKRSGIRLERVWCAVDAGRLVHPDGARNQIEGGVQQAASWTLLEELRMKDGVVVSSSWRDYPIATFHDAPEAIEVTFVGDRDLASTGVGEPGSVPTAAAIANAVFDACGKRVRRLPIMAAFA
ncbi:molybdopterin cofactor-binding domain-containing protein (plasmid) [Agrobacterium vitis]|uniref:xanthine dehydrogenase family protein molybdopterin-binding subunit n=1 Tax=Agrobacterium vitis TaxID=373 RepID=UPI003D2DDA9C